uniref:Putative secreted peptide n=1 Tax=Anopheles braziliensis TaxID=58242 RepID=A0A2M3ZMJ2_9DIPT
MAHGIRSRIALILLVFFAISSLPGGTGNGLTRRNTDMRNKKAQRKKEGMHREQCTAVNAPPLCCSCERPDPSNQLTVRLLVLVEEIGDAELITGKFEQLLTLHRVLPVTMGARFPAVAQVASAPRFQLRRDGRIDDGTGALLGALEQERPDPGNVVGARVLEQIRIDDARVQRVRQHRQPILLEHQIQMLREQYLGQLALVVRVGRIVVFELVDVVVIDFTDFVHTRGNVHDACLTVRRTGGLQLW